MFDLMKAINDRLSGTNYSVFFNEKSPTATYPFVIFNLPNANEGNLYREDFILEVDIWTKNISQNITMTNAIKNLFNDYKFLNSKVQVSFFIANRLNNIPDEDDTIKRSRLIIQAKTYFT